SVGRQHRRPHHRTDLPQQPDHHRRSGLRSPRPHRLPAPVPAHLRRLRETLLGGGVALTVRGVGTVPPRPAHRRLPPRPALSPRPHHHHHRTELPTHPPHYRRR